MFIKASGSGLYTKTIFCTFELEKLRNAAG